MNAMMKQAQKMQQDMMKIQAEIEARDFIASAGGGVVKATVSNKQLKSLEISRDAVDPDDVDMLCDLVIAAVNDALNQAEETMSREMGKLTGGMPGMF